MIYIGAYLLIGMIYAGIKFKGVIKGSLSEDEIKGISEKQKDGLTAEENTKLAVVFVVALIVSFFNILVWPFSIIVMRKPKNKNKGVK